MMPHPAYSGQGLILFPYRGICMIRGPDQGKIGASSQLSLSTAKFAACRDYLVKPGKTVSRIKRK